MSTFPNTFLVFSMREPERWFTKVNQIVPLPHLLRSLQWTITLWLISKIQAMPENLSGAGSSPSCFQPLPPHPLTAPCIFAIFLFLTWHGFSCQRASSHEFLLYLLVTSAKLLHLVCPHLNSIFFIPYHVLSTFVSLCFFIALITM